jgi:hypothetical protein
VLLLVEGLGLLHSQINELRTDLDNALDRIRDLEAIAGTSPGCP